MEMAPIVDGLNVEFEGSVSAIQLNAAQEANARLQNQWGLRGHPTFVILDDSSNVVQRLFGPQPEATLREAMISVIGQ